MGELFWATLSVGILILVQLAAFSFGYGKLWQHIKDTNGDIREIKTDVKEVKIANTKEHMEIKTEIRDAREKIIRVEEKVKAL